jgi:hypothetical protein
MQMQQQGSTDYFNGQMTAASLLGMSPGNQSRAAGDALRGTTAGAGDRPTTWWSPMSPTFWVVAVGVATVLGMAGADARVRLGRKGKAAVSVGAV